MELTIEEAKVSSSFLLTVFTPTEASIVGRKTAAVLVPTQAI